MKDTKRPVVRIKPPLHDDLTFINSMIYSIVFDLDCIYKLTHRAQKPGYVVTLSMSGS